MSCIKQEHDLRKFWKETDEDYFRQTTTQDAKKINFIISQLSPIVSQESRRYIEKEKSSSEQESPQSSVEDGIREEKQRDDVRNELDEELEKLHQSQFSLHIENVQKLLELKERSSLQEKSSRNSLSEDHSPFVSYKDQQNDILFNKRIHFANFTKESLQLQTEYIKDSILKLEDLQTSESIQYVIDCRKSDEGNNEYEFNILFDKTMADQPIWVPESVLDKLDKLRERSLFEVQNIPQKMYNPLNGSNVEAFNACFQKAIHRALDIPQCSWKGRMKKNFGESGSEPLSIFNRKKMLENSQSLDLCHYCKYLFPNKYLVKCGNTSPVNEALPTKLREQKEYLYKKTEDDYSCERKYCRNCLASNFQEHFSGSCLQNQWICPFCQGRCFCSRCLRNDLVNKLLHLLMSFGEDHHQIAQKSSLKKLVWSSRTQAPKQDQKKMILLTRPEKMIMNLRPRQNEEEERKNLHSIYEPSLRKKLKTNPSP